MYIKKKVFKKKSSVCKLEFKLTDSEQLIFTNIGFKDLSPKTMVEMLQIRMYTPSRIVLRYDKGCFQTDLDNAVFKTTTDVFCQLIQLDGSI